MQTASDSSSTPPSAASDAGAGPDETGPSVARGAEEPGGGSRARSGRTRLGDVGRRVFAVEELGVLTALVTMVLVTGYFHPDFLTKDVLLDILRTASFVALIAFGMVFLLAMTEIDLSVGGIYGVTIILASRLMADGGVNPWLAAVLAISLGVGLGAVNGTLASLFRIPVIIVTVGTLSLYRGLTSIISEGKAQAGLPVDSDFFTTLGSDLMGVPMAAWVSIAVCVLLAIVLGRTRFGAMVRATGSNRRAALFSGIPTGRVRMYALMLTGGLAAVAGMLSLAYFQGSDPSLGSGVELQVIAAAIIGGTAVSGGSGSVPGALLGALVVATINSSLVFFSVSANWNAFVTGAVIIGAIGIDAAIRRRRALAVG